MSIARTMAATVGAAALALSAGDARASIGGGELFVTPSCGHVFAEFASSDAGATGSLYFLGWQPAESPITYATSSDAKNLGAFVFSNKGTAAGTSVDLGSFEGGTTLHFAYLITKGSGSAKKDQVTRSDVGDDVMYFGLSAGSDALGSFSVVGLEDIKGGKSDYDYNDMVFNLRSGPSCEDDDVVPAPGGAALALAGWLLMAPRGRRPSGGGSAAR